MTNCDHLQGLQMVNVKHLSAQPSYVRLQDTEVCLVAFPSDSSKQQHGLVVSHCRWMKAKIGYDRMHSGLQNVIATGRVWKSKREMRNASLYHTSKFKGYQLVNIYKFQRSSLQRAPFLEGTGSKKTRAPWFHVISCGRGPTLECFRTDVCGK